MRTHRIVGSTILALALTISAGASLARDGAGKPLPAHPSELKFGELKFDLPKPDGYRHTLKNGVVVYVAEDHSLPLVDIGLTLRLGDFVEDPAKPGVAAMMGSLMRVGGTESMTAEQFDERVDFLAANMGAFVGNTSAGASMDCYSGVLDETLALFFEMMRAPRFQEDRIQVDKEETLEGMKQRNDRPQSIASREWQWLMRGEEHFTSLYMTEASLGSITREDLVNFHQTYWRPNKTIVTVTGDVDTREILAKLEQHFDGWEKGTTEVPWPPPAPEHTPRPGVYYVDKDIPQGRVQIGHLGHQRKDWNDKDAYPLTIMNDVLGGSGFTSRITKRIRSDEGLAYSAGSRFGIGEHWPGTFGISFQSKSPTVAFASKIAFEEVARIRDSKVSDEELRVSKNSIIDSFPRRFESPAQIVGTYAADEYVGRPHSYWKTYRDRISDVSANDVQRVAKRYLDPDKLVLLVVGKWEDIEPGDPDGRAAMSEFSERPIEIPLRDPLTLKPINQDVEDR